MRAPLRPPGADVTVLVTGFSTFPGAGQNPTERLIDALRRSFGATGRGDHIHFEVLPVTYAGIGEALPRLINQIRPDAAILFGLSARASGFQFERMAANTARIGRADAAGTWPVEGRIAPGDAQWRQASLPAHRFAAALRRDGFPATTSRDAGGYVCNAALFRALSTANCAPLTGFVHIPHCRGWSLPDDNAIESGVILRGSMRLLRLTIAEVRRQRI